MFVVDSEIPFAMICHPKTGSQSMQKILRQEFQARPVCGMHHFDKEECERILMSGGNVACTVRNPWDLMVSWYCFSTQSANYNAHYPSIEPFKPWLLRTLKAGNGWIEHGLFPGVPYCNRIFRFEHDLEYQLNNCLTDCGLPEVEFPHVGKTEHSHYSDYYDKETVDAVGRRFYSEIIEFGYTYEVDSGSEY